MHIDVAITATARTTIRIATGMARTSRIAIRTERTSSHIATQDTDTHHLGHGSGLDTLTNRGLADHPRMHTSSRGGIAEASARTSNGRAEQYRYLEAIVRARAWNEISPAIKWGWLNLAEAYGRLAEQAEKASGADITHPSSLNGRQASASWERTAGSNH